MYKRQIQFFAYSDLNNRLQSDSAAAFLYPRLKRYYDFMVGHNPHSTIRMPSGLLRTWDYFYSSGGWDDYPPQHELRSRTELYPSVAPMVTTSYYLRAAKILRMQARKMGLRRDVAQYDRDIRMLTDAIQRYDLNVVQTLVILYAALGIVGVFLGDVLMMLVDPRITLTGKEAAR